MRTSKRLTREELFCGMSPTEEARYLELEKMQAAVEGTLRDLLRQKRQIKKNVKKRVRAWHNE